MFAAEAEADGAADPAAADPAAAAARDEWKCPAQRLYVQAYEEKQKAKHGDRKAGNDHQYRYRVSLNAQMQAWVQLTGGGPNEPLRIIVYADICLLNQASPPLLTPPWPPSSPSPGLLISRCFGLPPQPDDASARLLQRRPAPAATRSL